MSSGSGGSGEKHGGNIFSAIPAKLPEELMQNLLKRPGVRIERIVSRGHASPEGFWYDPSEGEWVLLLAGSAGLEIEGRGETVLKPGDYLLLPAHCRHRVAWTDPAAHTVWLAVFTG